jgi:hypothetical protein
MEVTVYGLPIYIFDSHVNGAVRGHITGEVINPRNAVIQTVHHTPHYPL